MKLTRVEEVATGTSAYYFERPASFSFVPGQFVEVLLEDDSPADSVRSFSIASSPSEPDLMFATRSRDSAFKLALRSLSPGRDVEIDGPYGSLALRTDAGLPHVFIAGGIGITPFRSILVEAAAAGSQEPMVLFHANRDVAGAAFFSEMTYLGQRSPAFRFIPTLTRPSPGWEGETGYIDAAMLRRHLDPAQAVYYVSGPLAMVEATLALLGSIGVPGDRVRSETFEGY